MEFKEIEQPDKTQSIFNIPTDLNIYDVILKIPLSGKKYLNLVLKILILLKNCIIVYYKNKNNELNK